MPRAVCEWQVGLVSPGLWCRARGEQPTRTHTPNAGERLKKAIADPPSSLGFPCRISRPSQEMAGQPYKSTSRSCRERRHRHRHRAVLPPAAAGAAGLLGGVTGESVGMPQPWLRVAEPRPLSSDPRPWWGPLGLGGHLSLRTAGAVPLPPPGGDRRGCDNEQTGYTTSTGYSRASNY